MDLTILLLYVLFISSFLCGLFIRKNSKPQDLQILHKKYELIIFALIYLLFTFVNIVLIYTIFVTSGAIFILAFIAHIIFNLYLILDITKTIDTYANQYNLIIYNFFTIIIVYLCSLAVNLAVLNMYIILVMVYNIFEFQFSKFELNEFILWKKSN